MKNRLINPSLNTLLITILIFTSLHLFAQSGAIDPTFNPLDQGLNIGSGPYGAVNTSCIQSDGKMLIGGDFTSVNGIPSGYIARINPDGSPDNTFVSGSGFDYPVTGMLLQQDEKILVSGSFYTYNGTNVNGIVRLNPDGSLDNTFTANVSNNTIRTMLQQPDGKIMIGGSFGAIGVNPANGAARLNDDGTFDPSFIPNTGADVNTINSIAVQSDGKVILSGKLSYNSGAVNNKLLRLNSDGSPDASFNWGTLDGIYDQVRIILPQADGSLFVGGAFSTYNGINHRGVVHLLANGTIDPGFTIAYLAGEQRDVYDMAVLPNGKLIVVGGRSINNSSAGNCLIQLNTDGSIDTNFTSQALGTNTIASGNFNYIYTVSERADGTFLMGGNFSNYTNSTRDALAIINPDGSLFEAFNAQTAANGTVNIIASQPDGKILIGGEFTSYDGFVSYHIARLNNDGSLDQTFDAGFVNTGNVFAISVQPDGKILVASNPLAWDSNSTGKIIRLNTDGSIDPLFNTAVNSTLDYILLQPDGKIMIGGYFTYCNMTAINKIARLNSDGSLDLSFDPGSGPNDIVKGMVRQADGKLIIHGNFTYYNGTYRGYIARLNSDGSLDDSFNSGIGVNGGVNTVTQQLDGRLIISGFFNNYNSVQNNGIIRVFPDGTLDPTFYASNVNSNLGTKQLTIGPDGSIYFITYFDPFNILTNVGTLNRLKPNGAYDLSFIQGNTPNYTMKTFALQPDGKILIGGFFQFYNSQGKNRLVRIENSPIAPEITAFTIPSIADSCTGTVYFSVTGVPDFTFDLGGGTTITSPGYAVFDSLCPGIYAVEVTDGNGDLLNATFIIPADSSYLLYDPFINNPPIIDSITALVENCDIDYASIDSSYFDSYTFIGTDTVVVNWAIVDMNGTSIIPVTFILGVDGNYYFQLQFYCPEKAVGEFFVITQGVVYQNGELSTTLGITESESSSIVLYPNPTHDEVTFHFEEPFIRLIVADASGKVISTKTVLNGERVSLGSLSSGIYFFTIATEKQTVVKRIVKN
jgi:uncharacterized delta-60 repeat protein